MLDDLDCLSSFRQLLALVGWVIDKASEWLGWLVKETGVSYSTQKQALNGLVFFLRDVCGMEEIVLSVRLRKGQKREKVVMSVREVLAVLDRLDGDAHRVCTTGRDLVPKGMIEVVQ